MDNNTFTHNYFYAADNERARYSSVSYDGRAFYSYSTLIGYRAELKKGGEVFLCSRDSMTPTTRRHLGYLWSACPCRRIEVPFVLGDRYYDPAQLVERLKDTLEYNFNRLSLKQNREDFLWAFDTLNALREVKGFKIGSIPLKYMDMAAKLTDAEAVKAIKAKARAEQAELMRKFARMRLDKKAQLAYGSDADYDIKKRIQREINPKGELAFIWRDGDSICTSKGIKMPLEFARTAWDAYKAGKLKHGDKIDRYTICSILNDTVKIGCHLIPMQNIKEVLG